MIFFIFFTFWNRQC